MKCENKAVKENKTNTVEIKEKEKEKVKVNRKEKDCNKKKVTKVKEIDKKA